MVRKRWFRSLFMLLLMVPFLFLSGCLNISEPEDMFYVYAVGVDYDEKKGEYIVYAQVLNFQEIAKTGGGGSQSGGKGGNMQIWVGKGNGVSLDGAIQSMMITSQRRLYWGHLNAIILTERLMQHGIYDVIDMVRRFNEPKYTTWLFATGDSPESILSTSPILNEAPIKSIIGDPLRLHEIISIVPPIRFHRFVSVMDEPGETAPLIHLTTTSAHWRENRKKKEVMRVDGASFVRKEKYVATMKTKEILGLRWMTGRAEKPRLTLMDGRKPLATLVPNKIRPKIEPFYRGLTPYFRIKIRLDAQLLQLSRPATTMELKKKAERIVKEEVMETYKLAIQKRVDVYQLLHPLFHKDTKKWKRLIDAHPFPLKEDSIEQVSVEVNIMSTGKAKMSEEVP